MFSATAKLRSRQRGVERSRHAARCRGRPCGGPCPICAGPRDGRPQGSGTGDHKGRGRATTRVGDGRPQGSGTGDHKGRPYRLALLAPSELRPRSASIISVSAVLRVTADRQTFPRQPVADALQHGVCGRRNSVQPSELHDLSVEVVRLDVARPPLDALPGRAAGAHTARDRRQAYAARAAGAGLFRARAVDPRRLVARQGFIPHPPHDLPRAAVACRLQGVAEVCQELCVLLAHDDGVRQRAEAGVRDRLGDRDGHVVHARRVAPDIEDARRALGRVHDLAGLHVLAGQEDDHPVHAPETPQGDALIDHAVLGAHHGDIVSGGLIQVP